VTGGYEYDGALTADVREEEIKEFCEAVREKGIKYAVSQWHHSYVNHFAFYSSVEPLTGGLWCVFAHSRRARNLSGVMNLSLHSLAHVITRWHH